MIKKIIQISDVHIPNYQRIDEYQELLTNVISSIKTNVVEHDHLKNDELRIIICGDLVHQKNTISNELNVICSWFIRELEKIGKVVVISGNHDLIESNTSRMDTLSSLFKTSNFENSIFLDMELNYESGFYYDDNVIYALYSIWEKYVSPFNKNPEFHNSENKPVIGLFHGTVSGSQNYNGVVFSDGVSGDIFKECSAVMAGDIHKRQSLRFCGVPFVYAGSTCQRDFGESILEHGYVIWNIDEDTNVLSYKFVDIETTYGFYRYEINSIDDIDNDKEILTNLI